MRYLYVVFKKTPCHASKKHICWFAICRLNRPRIVVTLCLCLHVFMQSTRRFVKTIIMLVFSKCLIFVDITPQQLTALYFKIVLSRKLYLDTSVSSRKHGVSLSGRYMNIGEVNKLRNIFSHLKYYFLTEMCVSKLRNY